MNAELEIPLCPMCGRLLRKSINRSTWAVVGSSVNAYDHKAPWNYRWDGLCQSCGYNHNIYIREVIHTLWGDRIRMITVKAASQRVMDYPDAATVLSGVEIEKFSEEENEKEKIFISTNELKQLLNMLKESPLLEQIDWREDYT